MADEDEALFDSAMTDAPEAEAPEAGQPRDEHGRFAPKQAEVVAPEPQPEPEPAPVVQQEPQPKAEPGIPPWRLKEEAERRREAEARAFALEQRFAEIERQQQQKQQPVPDLYENPDAFVDHRARQHIDPLQAQQRQITEYYSRKDAIRAYGAEKVTAAYNAIGEGLRNGDPEAVMVYNRAMSSLDPFEDIVSWHQKTTVYSQIGSDPNAWFEKQLEERLKDPTTQAKLIERIRGNVQQPRPSVTQLPPSLNKATAALPPGDDDDDASDAGLLKTALRR